MPVLETRGALSAQNYGLSGQQLTYIEDVFSTWLYTGNGSTQTITNGINLSGKGGLVWNKWRSGVLASGDNMLWDTARGANQKLISNTTDANINQANGVSFDSTGFTMGANGNNNSGALFASWTFRKQVKFFDIVTYTGTGANRTIAHNLGSVPGSIFVKRTDTTGAWAVYHRSLANTEYMVLNTTAAKATGATYWNSTTPTSSVFSLGTATDVNANGGTYVAYLFAHDAGGFGLNGTDNVISCGSFTSDASGLYSVTLGYEPQWLLVKSATSVQDWYIIDNMRGYSLSTDNSLSPNSSGAEIDGQGLGNPTATGFANTTTGRLSASQTFIYIAIRRGPMKTPTTGTSVFGLNARTGTGANATVTGGQTDDAVLIKNRGSAVADLFASRLTSTRYIVTSSTAAELTAGVTALQTNPWDVMDGVKVGTTSTTTNASANTYINYLFRRSPGFFDVVCYTGTTAQQTVSHNLGAIPELIIAKVRSNIRDWVVYYGTLDRYLVLNTTAAFATDAGYIVSTSASNFVVGASEPLLNENGENYIAYLFATVAGVSKVGSYTGTGTTRQINCGFTGGARLVLIKRTDSTGDWYVWDTARGIVAGNDPYFLLNSTAAEVTGTDYVDTYSAGFEISSTAPAAINANGGSFIFLAIA